MFKTVGVVGAGLMGSEIALVFALAGRRVKLNDTNPALLDESAKRLERVLQKGIDRGLYAEDAIEVVLPQIQFCPTLDDYSKCDLVVEAVFEDEEVKSAVFGELDRIVFDHCVIASNTSSISITTLASKLCPTISLLFLMELRRFSPPKVARKAIRAMAATAMPTVWRQRVRTM